MIKTNATLRVDYFKPRFCPKCRAEMEHTLDIDREEYLIRRYHIWKCPICDYISSVEEI